MVWALCRLRTHSLAMQSVIRRARAGVSERTTDTASFMPSIRTKEVIVNPTIIEALQLHTRVCIIIKFVVNNFIKLEPSFIYYTLTLYYVCAFELQFRQDNLFNKCRGLQRKNFDNGCFYSITFSISTSWHEVDKSAVLCETGLPSTLYVIRLNAKLK